MSSDKAGSAPVVTQPLQFHVPRPASRPGEKPDFWIRSRSISRVSSMRALMIRVRSAFDTWVG